MPATDLNSILINFPYAPRNVLLVAASNFLPECGNLCVCCANCSGAASARCECANLFDTMKLLRAVFPLAAVDVFVRVAYDFEAYLWRARESIFPVRWPHRFPFSATRNFGIVRPVTFFWYKYSIPFVAGSGWCWRCTFQKHIFKMPFFVSPNFWYGGRHLQPRRRPAHSNTNKNRTDSKWKNKKMNAAAVEAVMGAQKASNAHTHTQSLMVWIVVDVERFVSNPLSCDTDTSQWDVREHK